MIQVVAASKERWSGDLQPETLFDQCMFFPPLPSFNEHYADESVTHHQSVSGQSVSQ